MFKGNLFNVPVAIKALSKAVHDDDDDDSTVAPIDDKQFTAEMELLKSVHHPNICRLLGISVDGPKRCLVLELMRGGSLKNQLGLSSSRTAGQVCAVMKWQQRLQVMVAVARALAYLHSKDPPMLHRDVKTANGTDSSIA